MPSLWTTVKGAWEIEPLYSPMPQLPQEEKKATVHAVIEKETSSEDISSVTLADAKALNEHALQKKAIRHSTAIFALMLLDQ